MDDIKNSEQSQIDTLSEILQLSKREHDLVLKKERIERKRSQVRLSEILQVIERQIDLFVMYDQVVDNHNPEEAASLMQYSYSTIRLGLDNQFVIENPSLHQEWRIKKDYLSHLLQKTCSQRHDQEGGEISMTTKTDSSEQTKVYSRQEYINYNVEKYIKALKSFDTEVLEPIKRKLRKEINQLSK